MPIFTTTIKVPKNTPKTSPKEFILTIEGDVLQECHIVIPPGHVALTGIAGFYGIEQLFPLPSGEWISGDDERISFPMLWEIPFAKATILLKGYNEDDTYDHSFIVRFIVTSFEEARWHKLLLQEIIGLRQEIRAMIGIPPPLPITGVTIPFSPIEIEVS